MLWEQDRKLSKRVLSWLFLSRIINFFVSLDAAITEVSVASPSQNSTVSFRNKESMYRCDYRRLLCIRSKQFNFHHRIERNLKAVNLSSTESLQTLLKELS